MQRIHRIAVLSVHTSPVAALGGSKTGGMNVYVREMAREMAQRGIMVDIFTRRTDPQTPEVDTQLGLNIRVVSVPCGPAAPLEPDAVFPYLQDFTAGVIAFTMRYQVPAYDMIYSHYWLSGWVAHKLKEVWGTPFAQMFHTLGQMKQRIAPGNAEGGAYPGHGLILPDLRITNETRVVTWADRLIAATEAEQAQLLWLYRADRRKISIIPPGVDAQRFQPQPSVDARRQLGLDTNAQLLLFVGRIEPLKAVDSILHAARLLLDQQPHILANTRIAIIGGTPDNPELKRLKALTDTLGIRHLVDFLGAKDQSQLSTYYAAASAVMMPSDYESFGMVALEAMASGTPVIASHVGGLAFLVRDAETGYLVPTREPQALANCMARLLADPAACQRLGENAARVAQSYRWQVIVDRLLEAFEAMLAEKKQNAPLNVSGA